MSKWLVIKPYLFAALTCLVFGIVSIVLSALFFSGSSSFIHGAFVGTAIGIANATTFPYFKRKFG